MSPKSKKAEQTLKLGPICDGAGLMSMVTGGLHKLDQLVLTRQERAELRGLVETVDMLPEEQHGWTSEQMAQAESAWLDIEDMLMAHLPPFCSLQQEDGKPPIVMPDTGALSIGQKIGEIGTTRTQSTDAPAFVLEVNDHGNMTMFRKDGRGKGHVWTEIWSVV